MIFLSTFPQFDNQRLAQTRLNKMSFTHFIPFACIFMKFVLDINE